MTRRPLFTGFESKTFGPAEMIGIEIAEDCRFFGAGGDFHERYSPLAFRATAMGWILGHCHCAAVDCIFISGVTGGSERLSSAGVA